MIFLFCASVPLKGEGRCSYDRKKIYRRHLRLRLNKRRMPHTCQPSPPLPPRSLQGTPVWWVNHLWQCSVLGCYRLALALSPVNNDRRPQWTPLRSPRFVPSTEGAQITHCYELIHHHQVCSSWEGCQLLFHTASTSEDLETPLPGPTPPSWGPSFQVYEVMGPSLIQTSTVMECPPQFYRIHLNSAGPLVGLLRGN